MKYFLNKLLLFLGINLLIAMSLLILFKIMEPPHPRYPWMTESNLYFIPKNNAFNYVILGNSHGKMFSRYQHHASVEKILGGSICNLSCGGGAGVIPAKLYLSYFFQRGNAVKTIIYFIDPYILYSAKWNEENFFATNEPFRLDFFIAMFTEHISYKVIQKYVRSKFTRKWIRTAFKEGAQLRNTTEVTHVKKELVNARLASLYPEGLNSDTFTDYCESLRKIILAAITHDANILFVIPPTLLGKTPGTDELISCLLSFKQEYDIDYYNYAQTMLQPELYSDLDHLNTKGVLSFAESLKKRLDGYPKYLK